MKFRSDLHAGRAGEHLAAADIIAQGHECFHAAQGMPYDLIADIDGRLVRVQVKTTRQPELLAYRNVNNYLYRFWVRRGKGGKKRYCESEIDLFALVALDERVVGYLGTAAMPATFFARPPSMRGKYHEDAIIDRNTRVREMLLSGKSVPEVHEETGLDQAYLYRVKQGRARLKPSGRYLDDMTLDAALDRSTNEN